MWWVEAVTTGFSSPTSAWRVQVFQMAFAMACLGKTTIAIGFGWDRFREGTYERYELSRVHGPARAKSIRILYRPLLLVRGIASVLLLFGVLPRTACIVIAAALGVELLYEKRFNTVYMCVLAVCLSCAGSYAVSLNVSREVDDSNTWAQFLIMINAWHIYWNSAWQKLRSRQFMSGLLLNQYLTFVSTVEASERRGEYSLVRRLMSSGRKDVVTRMGAWRFLAVGTVACEIVLPIGLMWEGSVIASIVIGFGMHVAFTVLMPRQILGFSIASVGTFVVFMQ